MLRAVMRPHSAMLRVLAFCRGWFSRAMDDGVILMAGWRSVEDSLVMQ